MRFPMGSGDDRLKGFSPRVDQSTSIALERQGQAEFSCCAWGEAHKCSLQRTLMI